MLDRKSNMSRERCASNTTHQSLIYIDKLWVVPSVNSMLCTIRWNELQTPDKVVDFSWENFGRKQAVGDKTKTKSGSKRPEKSFLHKTEDNEF